MRLEFTSHREGKHTRIGIGRGKGEVEQDEEGLRTMQILGQNMAWLLKKINI